MIRFIKRQLLRSWNIIKGYWDMMLFEFIKDSEFTEIGKYFVGVMMGMFLVVWAAIVIMFMPLILVMFKDNTRIGF